MQQVVLGRGYTPLFKTRAWIGSRQFGEARTPLGQERAYQQGKIGDLRGQQDRKHLLDGGMYARIPGHDDASDPGTTKPNGS